MARAGAGGRRRRAAVALVEAVALLALAALAALAPRWFDARAALEWTRYHATRPEGGRSVERARQVGRWAARVVDRLAPLPPAPEALRLALGEGRALSSPEPAAALALCAELRPVLARLAGAPWRSRPGAARALAEVEALQAQASAAAAAEGGRP